MNSSPFAKIFQKLISSSEGEYYSDKYYEFINGGDSYYGDNAPLLKDEWDELSSEERAALAEVELNRPYLQLRYPGTFNGPITSDLAMFSGLGKVIHFDCDSMQVETYTSLLDLPNLDKVTLDIFSHSLGYTSGVWSVFDALIFVHTKEFRVTVEGICKFRAELDLTKPFGVYNKEVDQIAESKEKEFLSTFLTMDFLYEKFARKR